MWYAKHTFTVSALNLFGLLKNGIEDNDVSVALITVSLGFVVPDSASVVDVIRVASLGRSRRSKMMGA